MPLTQLAPPYPIFTDKNGDPLDAGYLYFGVANLNPETNPIQVYYDSALTQPAAQPLRTSNGYVMRNGSPALLFAGSQFSVTVRNKNNELVIYSPVGYGVDPASISGTVIYDDFTGDGTTTIFTLTASPSTKNATNVYIDGVYQSKDNYNTVGSTLTFSTAPPLNSAIEVVSQESSIIGGASSQQITYNQGGSGAITRTVQSRLRDFVSVKDFGAVGDGVTDDTAAIQAAIDAVYGAGGGTVYFPTGDYVCLTLTVTATEANPLSLVGSADSAVVLKRTATSSQPVLNIIGLATPQQSGLSIENIKITGNAKTHDGIVATNIAYMSLRKVRASACDVGFNNKGSLVFSAYDCQFKSNNTGYKADANASIGTNLYQFFGGVISANTTLGVDLGEGIGFAFIGTDMSGNGTAGNTSTGGVRIRSNVDDETGVAFGSFKNCWLESNKGWSFYVEASALNLTIDSTQVLTPESGQSGYFGDIRSLTLINLNCPSVSDTIEVNAKNFISIGGQISNITDNSQNDSMIVGTSTATAGVGVRAEAFNPKIGGASAYGVSSGTVNTQYVAVGNVGSGEDDLMSYTLPANALDEAGNSFSVSAWGTSANNANAKTIRLYFAGTLIATLSLTTSQSNSWRFNAEAIWRSGGLLTVSVDVLQGGTVTQSTTIHTTLTGVNGAVGNILKVTGEGVADNDILQRAMKVTFAKVP